MSEEFKLTFFNYVFLIIKVRSLVNRVVMHEVQLTQESL